MERNLQNRLDAAREARRPLPPATPEAAPPESDASGDPPVIDLRTLRTVREAGRRALAGTDEAPPAPTGSSTSVLGTLARRRAVVEGEPITTTSPAQERCPNCGGSVRIDLYDLVASVAHLTCTDCGFLYTARSPHT